MADQLHGFSTDDLECIADGLEAGYAKTVNVGQAIEPGFDVHVESTTAAAARFIRAALASIGDTPAPQSTEGVPPSADPKVTAALDTLGKLGALEPDPTYGVPEALKVDAACPQHGTPPQPGYRRLMHLPCCCGVSPEEIRRRATGGAYGVLGTPAEQLREATRQHGHCPECRALHPQHHAGCTRGVTVGRHQTFCPSDADGSGDSEANKEKG